MCWLASAKKLADVLGAGFAQRLQQPFRHGPKQFVGLHVQWRLRQARIAPVKQCGAQ
jgi:hypothetical protein